MVMKIIKDVYMVGSGQIRLSNPMDCHVYLVDYGEGLILIDAGVGLETEFIIQNIREEGYDEKNVQYLLLTHCHADHAGGCKRLKALTECKVVATEFEGNLLERGTDEELGLNIAKRTGIYPENYVFPHCKPDWTVRDGEEFELGRYHIKVIEVPGHSKGSACYLFSREDYRILFSSDVVFFDGTIGLGNWAGSSLEDYRKHIDKLSDLAVDALLPGHFLWTLKDGQKHLDKAIENLKLAWVPPAWQHRHPHR
ncbi:MBL fold metallo-hydrolase [Candidatus Bathyarchaeota archaeon]|nr:MBL fold metallo-hydrolase [Candidatus Bathyarchaeota archaeon]